MYQMMRFTEMERLPLSMILVHKPNTDFGYNPKIPSPQHLLVFSIRIEGALHEYGWRYFCIVKEIISRGIEYELAFCKEVGHFSYVVLYY